MQAKGIKPSLVDENRRWSSVVGRWQRLAASSFHLGKKLLFSSFSSTVGAQLVGTEIEDVDGLGCDALRF
jgi:hypothetical protein